MSDEHGAEGEGSATPEAETPQVQFEPVVQLQEVATKTGEEDEEVIYKQRCALYRFVNEEWKERGKGDVKFLKHSKSGRVRLLMRQEKTLKLVLNQIVDPLTELCQNAGSDRAWTWAGLDYSDEPAARFAFAIKFKNSEIANLFKAVYNEVRESNKNVAEGKAATVKKHLEEEKEGEKKTEEAAAPKPAEEKKSEEKKAEEVPKAEEKKTEEKKEEVKA